MSHVPKTAACKFISSKLMRHDPADKFPEALPQPVKSDERGFGDLEDQRYLEDEKQANVQIVESLMQRGLSLDEAVRKAYPDYNDKAVDKFKQDYSKSASVGDLCKRAMALMEKQAHIPSPGELQRLRLKRKSIRGNIRRNTPREFKLNQETGEAAPDPLSVFDPKKLERDIYEEAGSPLNPDGSVGPPVPDTPIKSKGWPKTSSAIERGMHKLARSAYKDQGATWGQYFNPFAWGTISRTNRLNRESQKATQRTGTTRAPGKPPEPGDTDYIDLRELKKSRPPAAAPKDVMDPNFKIRRSGKTLNKLRSSISPAGTSAKVAFENPYVDDWAGQVGEWYEGLSPRYKDLALGGTAGLGVGAIHGLFDDEEDDEGESPSLLRRLGRGLGHGAIGAGIGGLATAGLGAGLDRLNKPGPVHSQTRTRSPDREDVYGPLLDITPPHDSVPISDRLRLGGGPLLNRISGLRTNISPLAEMWNERALSAASLRRNLSRHNE